MASMIAALETQAAKGWWKEWQNPAWKQFVLTGDEKQLKKLPRFSDHSWLPPELLSALPTPSQIDDQGKRFLQACCVAEHPQAVGNWIQQRTMREGADTAEFSKACTLLLKIGCPKLFLAEQVAQYVRPLCEASNAPTPAGDFLLALEPNTLKDLLSKISRSGRLRAHLQLPESPFYSSPLSIGSRGMVAHPGHNRPKARHAWRRPTTSQSAAPKTPL